LRTDKLRCILRIGFGCWFAVAALMKYAIPTEPNSVPTVLSAISEAIPGSLAWLLAGKALLAVWLWSGWRATAALITVAAVLSAFSGILTAELYRDTARACGCLGSAALRWVSPTTSLQLSIGTNVLGIGMALWVANGVGLHRGVTPASLSV
jgi:hypothetical protein